MARIVLGIGSSHSPLLSTPAEEWGQRAEADRRNPELWFRGKQYTFDELLVARRGEDFTAEITPEKMEARYAATQQAIDALGETLARVAPDVAVVVGEDQQETFARGNMPALAVYWGATMEHVSPTEEQMCKLAPGLAIAMRGWYPPDRRTYPGEPALGEHLIRSLTAQEFDVAHYQNLPAGRYGTHGVPHAYGFVFRRIMRDRPLPTVPVFINTYYPPNQVPLKRCHELGRALRRGIESWDGDKTVAVIASGGLTHFVIEEDLDRQVIAAMQHKDAAAWAEMPAERFNSGTSEIRNWIALAGAMADSDRQMHVLDYVPCYRSPAGTGTAMCFAQWL